MSDSCVIIGGGVAGLSAAIRLTELNIFPLVLEGGAYPSHKVCGEFLSPECIPLLNQWEINPVSIYQTHLRTKSSALSFQFPSPAGGLSHAQLDPLLARYAELKGASIRTETKVIGFRPKQQRHARHEIELSNGEILRCFSVIFATGRIPGFNQHIPPFPYIGIKAHFKNIPLSNSLEMFSFHDAYLGIEPIEEGKFNVACLATIKSFEKSGKPERLINSLMHQHPMLEAFLSKAEMIFLDWMSTKVPPFGMKQTPAWFDSYFIGDAAMTIPPACGDGLSLALIGGYQAANYVAQEKDQDFKTFWSNKCRKQLFGAKVLHQMMLNPVVGSPLLKLANVFPILSKQMYNLTRTYL